MSEKTDPKSNIRPIKPLLDSLPEAQDPSLIAFVPAKPKNAKLSQEQEAEAEAHFKQANLLRMRSELKQSLAELVKAIEIDPYNANMRVMQGDLLARLGRETEAVEAFEKAKSLARSPQESAAIESKIVHLIPTKLLGAALAEETELLNGADRNWGMIIFASLFIPGLGQLLIGQIAKGVAFLLISIICYLAVFWPIITKQPSSPNMLVPMGEFGLALAILVVSVIDVYFESKKSRK
jgi:tetratricopeptide (TPR) repeat protein